MRKALRVGGILTVAGLLALGGWALVRGGGAVHAANPPAPPPAVPVATATVSAHDVPVLLEGLGTVQAFNAVEIRAQVSGTLVSLPVKEGQEVRNGDIVAVIDPKPYQAALDQATAQRQGDQAQLESAQLDLQRYQTLAKQSFAPVQQVDQQRATVNKLQASIAADGAAIEQAQINLNDCVIRSPIDGRVSLRQLDVGNLVQSASSTNIISITQDKPISVVFTLPENELPQVQDAIARGAVPVTVRTADDQRQLATGTLLSPNNTIDVSTGTIQLKATFDNGDDRLWPGEFVNTRTQVGVLKGALTVPSSAVQHGPNGLFAFVVKPDQTVAQANVESSYQSGDQSVVAKGLNAGDTVVVSGQSRLAPGTRVQPQAPNAPPANTAGSSSQASG